MKAVLEYLAKKEDEGKSAQWICKQKFGISSGLLTTLKLNGKLKINGDICRSVDTLKDGDVFTADVTEEEKSQNIVPSLIELDIVYEDEYLIVINKPRNMCVHPSIKNYDNTLANGLIYYWQSKGEIHKFHAVNRIDKDTSGICVIAKNRFAHGVLSEQIKNQRFSRRYLAITDGVPEVLQGIIDKPIKRAQEGIMKRMTAPDGKRAVTHYKVINFRDGYGLVDVFLETGRTHQIRVHFSDIGCPLVGDWLYGKEEKEKFSGHLLHAYYAEFYHPATRELLKFQVPLPEDMKWL